MNYKKIVVSIFPHTRRRTIRMIWLLLTYWLMCAAIPLLQLVYGQVWDTPVWYLGINLPLGATVCSMYYAFKKLKKEFSPVQYRTMFIMPVLTLITPSLIVLITKIVR